METIKGTITRVLFSSEDTGFKVLKIKTTAGTPAIVTGEFGPETIPETAADFHGDFRTHPKYGTNFRALSYHITYDAGFLSSIRLFIDNIAPNIGTERSSAIVNHFGSNTISILDENPQRLSEVPGIGDVSSKSLAKAWAENRKKWDEDREIYSIRAFLNSLGFREKKVKKILTHFGGGGLHAEENIRKDPYVLSEIEGFGFTTADFVAKKLGIPENDPSRLRAFILYLLETICPANGHLYLQRSSIPAFSNKYCRENGTMFLGTNYLSEKETGPVIDALEAQDRIIVDEDCVYSTACYNFENESAHILSRIMTTKSDLIFLTKESVEDHIEKFERDNNLTLSEEQKKALYFFVEHKVFVITGPPGTGKTTILKAIVNLAKKMKLRLTCMTPTGISAKKLATTVNHEACRDFADR